MKKMSRDIQSRNIPTDFERNQNIGCRVTDVDGRTDGRTDGWTDRQTDRPTTRHGSRQKRSILIKWRKCYTKLIKLLNENKIVD